MLCCRRSSVYCMCVCVWFFKCIPSLQNSMFILWCEDGSPCKRIAKRNFYFLYNVVFLLEEKKKRSSVSNDDVVQRANQLKNCTGSYQKRPTFLVEKNSLYFLNSVWELYALSDVCIRHCVNTCSTRSVCVLLCVIFLNFNRMRSSYFRNS